MRSAFLCIAVATALATPALARETAGRTKFAGQNATVIAPRTVDVPRNTLITSRGTFTLNADGTVKSRQVASSTQGKGKLKYRTY